MPSQDLTTPANPPSNPPSPQAAWYATRKGEACPINLATDLTVREFGVFFGCLELRHQDVADKLGCSSKTIEWHIVKIGQKLGTTHRGTWMRWAIEQGLVTARGAA